MTAGPFGGSLAGRVEGRRRYVPTAAVAVASFGAFLAFLDSTVVNVAFPNIQAAFPHAGVGMLSWILNAYNVVFAGLLVLCGRLADLLGRRRTFLAGLVVFVAMSALCAAATSVPLLIAFRILQGAGAAMLVPASLGIVVHAASKDHQAHAVSLWAAAAALAAGLGPPIGGALVDLYDWRLVFLVNIPLGLVAWWLTRRTVLESRAPGVRTLPDLRGAFGLSVGLGAATLGIVQGSSWGWTAGATVAAFAIAIAALTFTVQSSRRHPSPVLDMQLLRIRGFAVSNLVTLAAGLGLYTYLLTHILWLHYVWGYSLLLAGLSVAPGAAVTAVVATPLGHLADRVGARAVAVPGALLWAGAYLWYFKEVGLHPDFLGQWLPGQIMSGVGVAATLPVATSAGLATVPAGRYATGSAVNSSVRQVGGVVGIAILSVFIAHPSAATLPGDLRHGWALAGWSFVAAAVAAIFLDRTRPGVESVVGPVEVPAVTAAEPTVAEALPSFTGHLLHELAPAVRDQVLQATSPRTLKAGETLFEAGQPGDALYFLEAGRMQVRFHDGSARDLYPGASIGELALITDAPRSATVVAKRDSTLRELRRDAFGPLTESQPTVVGALARGIARQLQHSRPPPAAQPPPAKVIAIAVLGPGGPSAELVATLLSTLQTHGRVAHLHDATPEALERAERDNRWVLLTSGPGGESDRALRQADRAILVATDPEPPLGAPLRIDVAIDVVLTGAAVTEHQICGWHEVTSCTRVYHAGRDPSRWAASLRPLSARLAGRSLALVLSGGGARALAHLGVLHALEGAGVEVDRVAGSSIGALIAAAYGTGASAAEVDQMVFDELVVGQPFGGFRISTRSLASGERKAAMLRRCFGDLRFESMAREVVVASTDLYAAQAVYHRRGPVAEAVAASMALPVLFPPQEIGGRLLVDGSLSDECPVRAFSETGEGPVLAVRIAPTVSPDSGIPSIGETLLRVVDIGNRHRQDSDGLSASLTVTPDTTGVGLFEFHQIDVAREAGRRAGLAAVEALTRTGLVAVRTEDA